MDDEKLEKIAFIFVVSIGLIMSMLFIGCALAVKAVYSLLNGILF